MECNSRLLISAMIITLALWPGILTVSTANAIEHKMEFHYSNILGLKYLVYSDGNGNVLNVSRVFYIENKNLLVMGGNRFFSLVNLTDSREEIRGSVLGSITVIGYDRLSSPTWIALGSSLGEVVGLRLTDGYRVGYLTSTGSDINDILVASMGSSTWSLAVDRKGYLYVFKLGSEGWAVIGPRVSGDALSGLSGVPVKWIAALKAYNEDTYYDPERILVITDSTNLGEEAVELLRGDLYIEAFYIDEFKRIHPAAASIINISESEVEVRELSYSVEILPYGLVYTNGTIDRGNLIRLIDVPKTQYRVHVLYYVRVVDKELNVTISRKCYYGFIDVDLKTTIEITNITLTRQDTVETCIAGLKPRFTDIGLSELILLNSTAAPEHLDYKIKLYPWPKSSGGLSEIPVYSLVKPATKAQGMPASLNAILAVATSDRRGILIYLLDRDLNPIEFSNSSIVVGGIVEPVTVNDGVSYIEISKDGNYIIIGTLKGRIIILEWNSNDNRYSPRWSILVSNKPIKSITMTNKNYAIAIAEDGTAQLLDISNREILWISDRPYKGLDMSDGSIVDIGYIGKHAIYAVNYDGRIIEFKHELRKYIPIILNINIILNNMTKYNGYILIDVLEDGEKKAELELSSKDSSIYAPMNSNIDIVVNIDGVGKVIYPNINVRPDRLALHDTIYLRSVKMRVYTPNTTSNNLHDMIYSLVSGPVYSANITLSSNIHVIDDKFIDPITINVTTDDKGEATATLFDNISYSMQVEKPGYHSNKTILEPRIREISIELHPLLYNVTLETIDSDAMSKGIKYYAIDVSYTITLIETGRSISVKGNPLTLSLPMGTYRITASSPHYNENTVLYHIDNNIKINILINPIIYNIKLNPELEDNLLNLATGPLTNAVINITLIEPYEQNIGLYKYNSAILARFGIYKIEVIDEIVDINNNSLIITINESKVYRLMLQPKYANVKLNVFDYEVSVYRITNLNLRIEYRYSGWSNVIVLNTTNNPYSIMVPVGDYRITISSIGYEPTPIEKTIHNNVELDIYMKPVYREYMIQVAFDDKALGLASGGVPQATLRLDIVYPSINKSYTVTTTQNGIARILLREGVYRLEVSGSYIENLETIIELGERLSIIVYVEPKYYRLNVTAIDSETLDAIGSYILEIRRIGPGIPNVVALNATPGYLLSLPAGVYELRAYIEGVYKPRPFILDLSRDKTIILMVEPVKVNMEILVLSNKGMITYRNTSYTLPSTPVANAIVRLESISALYKSRTVFEGKTDIDGKILFKELRPGLYLIKVIKQGYDIYVDTIDVRVDGVKIIYVKPLYHEIVLKPIDDTKIDTNIVKNVNILIFKYNNINVNIQIRYSYPETIRLPSGVYNIAISATEYVKTSKNLVIESDSRIMMFEFRLKPVEYKVELFVEYESYNRVEPLVFGIISVESIDRIKIDKTVPIVNGRGVLELPKGNYTLYYSISPELISEYSVKIGEVSVKGDSKIKLRVHVNNVSISLSLLDGPLKTPIVNESKIHISYHGPFGSYNSTITAKSSNIVIHTPPGQIEFIIESPYHKPFYINQTIVNSRSLNVYLDPIVTDVSMRILDELNNSVIEPILVTLKHMLYPAVYEVKANNSIAFFDSIRVGPYIVELKPINVKSVLAESETRVIIDINELEKLYLNIKYKKYNITIKIIDAETRDLVDATHIIALSSQTLTKTIEIDREASILIPVGNYTLKITPKDPEFYKFYKYKDYSIDIWEPTPIIIELEPRRYTVTIIVVRDGNPLENAKVTIYDINGRALYTGYTDSSGSYKALLRPGDYIVEASKRGYSDSKVSVEVPDVKPAIITLIPVTTTLILDWAPLIALVLVITFVIILYRYYMK